SALETEPDQAPSLFSSLSSQKGRPLSPSATMIFQLPASGGASAAPAEPATTSSRAAHTARATRTMTGSFPEGGEGDGPRNPLPLIYGRGGGTQAEGRDGRGHVTQRCEG